MCLDKRLVLTVAPATGYKVFIRDKEGNLRFPATGKIVKEGELLEETQQLTIKFGDTEETYESGFHFSTNLAHLQYMMRMRIASERIIIKATAKTRAALGIVDDFEVDCFIIYECGVEEVFERGQWFFGDAYVCKKVRLLAQVDHTTNGDTIQLCTSDLRRIGALNQEDFVNV